ncbi:MAG: hypothetical protein AB7T49_11090 [Oligoflexales bacterium]
MKSRIAQRLAMTLSILFSNVAFSTLLPPNDLYLQDDIFRLAGKGISEEQFNAVLDELEAAYKPIVESHNAILKINRLWSNSEVNASAQRVDNQWIINLYGGLARRPELTPDAFTLAACHELGHHLAGFPFYGSIDISAEGQSDYFATHACAKLLWNDEDEENKKARDGVSLSVQRFCDSQYVDEHDQNLCYRTMAGAIALANFLTMVEFGLPVSVDSPSNGVVLETVPSHPSAQCRLDTYLAGSLCTKKFLDDGIPHLPNEVVDTSCTIFGEDLVGLRPRCWFKESF